MRCCGSFRRQSKWVHFLTAMPSVWSRRGERQTQSRYLIGGPDVLLRGLRIPSYFLLA